MSGDFDILLSYNSRDKDAAREIKTALKKCGLRVWLDKNELTPGQIWHQEFEESIKKVRSVGILLGEEGLGCWQERELWVSLEEGAQRDLSVIPIRLKNAPELPLFLKAYTWVDFSEGITKPSLDRLIAGINHRPPSDVRPKASLEAAMPSDSEDYAAISEYRGWAAEQYRGLNMIGVGRREAQLQLDDVYVPLRIFHLKRSSKNRGAKRDDNQELNINKIFSVRDESRPHLVIFGGPGAGKTTVLRRLHGQCLVPEERKALGLHDDAVPLFLRLRRFSEKDLDRPLKAFIQRELSEVSGGKLAADLGLRLWRRGHLLLLLDGIDEIADDQLRARVSVYLDMELRSVHQRHICAVISCRHSGYGNPVRLEDLFHHLEVGPLDAGQCRKLVKAWFTSVIKALPEHPDQEAHKAASRLLGALDGADYGSQQLKVLVSSPLLLTQLCVVVLNGEEMPKHRAAFYGQCLRVLLAQWAYTRTETGSEAQEPVLDVESALAVLQSLAYDLHRAQRHDNLMKPEFVLHAKEQLDQLGKKTSPPLLLKIFQWLHREAGVLKEFEPKCFGLMHLGMQEYLTALHVASKGEDLLDEVCERFTNDWWHEVVRLLVGMEGHQVFIPLLERVLKSDALLERADLIRTCLEEAAEPDLKPFLDLLASSVEPERQAALLRLVRGRSDSRLHSIVSPLTRSPQKEVAALAFQVLAELNPKRRYDILLFNHPTDNSAALVLTSQLRKKCFRVLSIAEDSAWESEVEHSLENPPSAVAAVGSSGLTPWDDPFLLPWLELLESYGSRLVPVMLPGAEGEIPALPELAWSSWVDLRRTPSDTEPLEHAIEALPTAEEAVTESKELIVGENFHEAVTGQRILWIPGGAFQMGSKKSKNEGPIHRVEISPFWLAETPVTNQQYAMFLKDTRHDEPKYWRDRRFSEPDQPVVGISWGEARNYCEWLRQKTGLTATLPTEAQWEFSARGFDSRDYPWGNDGPDPTRACFNLDLGNGQPAPVGSFLAGMGPFKTLDQAGNVWEWCLDAWDPKAYSSRFEKCVSNPFIEGDAGSFRMLRGGGWANGEERLRAAYRLKSRASSRSGDIGFRIVIIPRELG